MARAQEFSLHIGYYVNDAVTPDRIIVFGYDPTASDQLTDGSKWFNDEFPGGEQEYPSDPFGEIDCRWGGQVINRPYMGTGGPIDIRTKPALDSFQLRFEIDTRAPHLAPVKLTWNSALIPAIIHHIYLSSGVFSTKPRLDMRTQNEFVLPTKDSSGLYDKMVLTVLYNEENLGVAKPNTSEETQLFPSVISKGDAVFLSIKEDKTVSLVLTDLMGRSPYSTKVALHSGVNRISDLTVGLPSGLYLAEVTDVKTGVLLSRDKIVVR